MNDAGVRSAPLDADALASAPERDTATLVRTRADTPAWESSTRGGEKSQLLDRAYSEYCQLQGEGSAPDPDEFCGRFPSIQTSLRRLLEAHRFFEENSDLLAEFRPVSWPVPGSTFLGFVLVRELGRGAFARVFLATEPELGHRQVAVKISLRGGPEAETLGRLEHPNVVPVHSVRTEAHSGLSVVCMPYLGRATLCDVLDHVASHRGMPRHARDILDAVQDVEVTKRQAPADLFRRGSYVDGVLYLGLQLAEALAVIHRQGVWHRDLKPSNVLMTPDGRPMLLDFNLSADEKTADQRMGGTLPYMSPEQLLATDLDRRPEHSLVDARSDVYSLGVVLYELLAGRHPFGPVPLKMTSQELRKLLLKRQQAGCQPLVRGVGRSVISLVAGCLAFNPQDRPQSAGELAAGLKKELSWSRRLRRRLAQRWRLVAGVTAAAVAAITMGVWCLLPQGTYAERKVQQAEMAYRQGLYAEALQHLTEAKGTEPDMARAYFLSGRALQQLGSIELALEQYQEAARLQPDGRTSACIAFCKFRSPGAKYQETIQHNLEAIAAGFKPAEVYSNLGCCYLQLNKLEEAQNSLNEAIARNPYLATAYHLRAKVDRQRMTNMSGAYVPSSGIADIRQAIQLDPDSTEVYSDAAFLCAFAARSDPHWIKPAVGYLRLAIDRGYDPKLAPGNRVFIALTNDEEFREQTRRPRVPNRYQAAQRILDPVDDLPAR